MPASKTKDSKKSQRQRFIDAAREAGASEDEAEFDEALRHITRSDKVQASPKRPPDE